MKSFAILAVLLCGNWLVCDAFWPFSSELDAVSQLSERLVNITSAEDLDSNVRAARQFNWALDISESGEALKEAVAAFKGLNSNDVCEWESLRYVTQLIRLARLNAKTISEGQRERRVFRLLAQIKARVNAECFARYEQVWNSDATRTQQFEETFYYLKHVHLLMKSWTKQAGLFTDFEALSGAIQLLRNPKLHQYRLTGESVRNFLQATWKDAGNSAPLGPISQATASELINKYLIEPCGALVVQPDAREIFGPVMLAAALVDMDDVGDKLAATNVAEDRASVFWTARYLFCSIGLKRTDFAKVAKEVASN